MTTASRLFLTCWLLYSIHFATNTVREIYLALSIGEHLSFRVDEYAGLHPDLFELPDRGWHINNNPGASMLAAIPWSAVAPVAGCFQDRVKSARAGRTPPVYDSPWPMAREFHRKAWERGLDIKFGIASVVTQMLCMAPLSALGVVMLHGLLRRRFEPRAALALALLYAFGTPVFHRAGYLNQNMLAGHFALFSWVALTAGEITKPRAVAAGLCAGACVLMDYTGVIALAALGLWLLASVSGAAARIPMAARFAAGAAVPLALLAFYQFASFGNPLFPAQHWMPASTAGNSLGYHGLSLPEPALLWESLADPRYGLFPSAPLFLLAFAAPFLARERSRELAFTGLLFVASWVFFASIYYSRLQFNTGVRYMALLFPFLFLATAGVLMKLPRAAALSIGAISIAYSWTMAMYRDMERGWGVLEPLLEVLRHGPALPALLVLRRMGNAYGDWGVLLSPWPVFVAAAISLWLIWRRAEV